MPPRHLYADALARPRKTPTRPLRHPCPCEDSLRWCMLRTDLRLPPDGVGILSERGFAMLKKWLLGFGLAALLVVATSAIADAGVSIRFNIGVPAKRVHPVVKHPRFYGPAPIIISPAPIVVLPPVIAHRPVWVPGRWCWTSWGWQWVPGHWVSW
jgi:hypothetical protein